MVLVLLAWLQITSADPTPSEMTAWRTCLEKQTLHFETTGEAPHDIALAAVDVCKDAEPNVALGLRMRMHQVMVDKMAGRVVEIRACKRERRCIPSKLPW